MAHRLLFSGDMHRAIVIGALSLAAACAVTAPALDPSVPPTASSRSEDDGPLRVIAIDVGQGDATLVVAPSGEAILIDAGPPGAGKDAVLPLLQRLGIRELHHAIVTHYHEDHFGGFAEVLAGTDGLTGTVDDIRVTGDILDRGETGQTPESPLFPAYLEAAAERRRTISPGDQIPLGAARLFVAAAGGALVDGTFVDLGQPPDENAASIVLLIAFGDFRMLVAGDITGGCGTFATTPDVETPLGAAIGDVDVLRTAHHGSHTSTNAALLAATTPELAVISVGDGNDFSHPHASVVERLLDAGIPVIQTERGWTDIEGPTIADGDIVIEVFDDGRWEVRSDGPTVNRAIVR